MRSRVRAVLTSCLLAVSVFTGNLVVATDATEVDPQDPAVRNAYVGPATPEKSAAALAGLNHLLSEIDALNPTGVNFGFFGSADFSFFSNGGFSLFVPPPVVSTSVTARIVNGS